MVQFLASYPTDGNISYGTCLILLHIFHTYILTRNFQKKSPHLLLFTFVCSIVKSLIFFNTKNTICCYGCCSINICLNKYLYSMQATFVMESTNTRLLTYSNPHPNMKYLEQTRLLHVDVNCTIVSVTDIVTDSCQKSNWGVHGISCSSRQLICTCAVCVHDLLFHLYIVILWKGYLVIRKQSKSLHVRDHGGTEQYTMYKRSMKLDDLLDNNSRHPLRTFTQTFTPSLIQSRSRSNLIAHLDSLYPVCDFPSLFSSNIPKMYSFLISWIFQGWNRSDL